MTTTWSEYAIEDVVDKSVPFPIVDGPFGTQLHADEYVAEGVPLVRITNLTYEGKYRSSPAVYITEQKALVLARSAVIKDDLVIAKTGATIGKLALFPFSKGTIASSCLKISLDQSKFSPRFLLYLFASPEGQKKILDGASGSTRTTINIDPLKAIRFHLPPLEQQAKIAEVLATVDRALAQTDALLAKQQRIKAGLMQELLARGIDEAGNLRQIQNNESVLYPAWKIKRLGEVAEVASGVTLGQERVGPNTLTLPYLRVFNVQDGYLNLSDVKTVTIRDYELNRYRLQKGDVLMNEGGDFDKLGRGAVWQGQIEPCLHQNHVFRVRTNRAVLLPDFLALISSSAYGKAFFVLNSKQSTNLASINSTQIKSFPVPCPDLQEQERILEVVEKQDRLQSESDRSYRKLTRLKTGLMQDLLTGRVSVSPLVDGSE